MEGRHDRPGGDPATVIAVGPDPAVFKSPSRLHAHSDFHGAVLMTRADSDIVRVAGAGHSLWPGSGMKCRQCHWYYARGCVFYSDILRAAAVGCILKIDWQSERISIIA